MVFHKTNQHKKNNKNWAISAFGRARSHNAYVQMDVQIHIHSTSQSKDVYVLEQGRLFFISILCNMTKACPEILLQLSTGLQSKPRESPKAAVP